MSKSAQPKWLDAPAEHDYPAAAAFLKLIASDPQIEAITSLLAKAPTTQQHAKDILRASQLPLLGAHDGEVARALKRIAKGVPLSPILLVRGDVGTGAPLQIADGYHRVCASYHLNEDTDVPCRLVGLPALAP